MEFRYSFCYLVGSTIKHFDMLSHLSAELKRFESKPMRMSAGCSRICLNFRCPDNAPNCYKSERWTPHLPNKMDYSKCSQDGRFTLVLHCQWFQIAPWKAVLILRVSRLTNWEREMNDFQEYASAFWRWRLVQVIGEGGLLLVLMYQKHWTDVEF